MLIQVDMPSPSKKKPPTFFETVFAFGFRPLYLLSAFWAAFSVLLWVFAPHLIKGTMGSMYWHAHEMLWGFIASIAVAFLLTASATWTGRHPSKGAHLAVITALWIVARIGYLIPGKTAFVIAAIAELGFFAMAAIALAKVIFKAKSKQNYPVVFALTGLALANAAYLLAIYQNGYHWIMKGYHVGLVIMAFIALLVGRRVIPFFASRRVQGDIPRHEKSGKYQLMITALTIALLVFGLYKIAAITLVILVGITWYQFFQWRPLAVMSQPLLWVLYISYFLLGLGLLFAAMYFAEIQFPMNLRPAAFVHIIGMGGFAVMIMGMITRTALGHTGRPLEASRLMVASYVLMIAAAVFRIVALATGNAMGSLHITASLWILAFILYLWQFAPILTKPRADGKPG